MLPPKFHACGRGQLNRRRNISRYDLGGAIRTSAMRGTRQAGRREFRNSPNSRTTPRFGFWRCDMRLGFRGRFRTPRQARFQAPAQGVAADGSLLPLLCQRRGPRQPRPCTRPQLQLPPGTAIPSAPAGAPPEAAVLSSPFRLRSTCAWRATGSAARAEALLRWPLAAFWLRLAAACPILVAPRLLWPAHLMCPSCLEGTLVHPAFWTCRANSDRTSETSPHMLEKSLGHQQFRFSNAGRTRVFFSRESGGGAAPPVDAKPVQSNPTLRHPVI